MPLTPVGLTATLTSSLVMSGMLGSGVPQLALGIATGTCLFLQQATVVTIDAGTLGTGLGTLPLLVPQQLILANVLMGMASQDILGAMSPPLALGIANGLAQGFPQGLILTTHTGVGVGTGMARVMGGSATPLMLQGFTTAGLEGQGSVKQATAMGTALDAIFKVFSIPIPIVGPPAPSAGAGSGFGKIV